MGNAACRGNAAVQVAQEPTNQQTNRIQQNPRIRLYWDLDSIRMPSQALDEVLGKLQSIHEQLDLGGYDSVDFKLQIVGNKSTNDSIQDGARTTLHRWNIAPQVTTNQKEAADRKIENEIKDAHLSFLRDKNSGLDYILVLGVVSNDEDYATSLKEARKEKVRTVYITQKAELREKANVKAACTDLLDWASFCPPAVRANQSNGPASPPTALPPVQQQITAGSPEKDTQLCSCSVPGCSSERFRKPKNFKGNMATIKCKSCLGKGNGSSPSKGSPPPKQQGQVTQEETLYTCPVEGCTSPPFPKPKSFKGNMATIKCKTCYNKSPVRGNKSPARQRQ